ncbi:hypothetical protein DB30_06907 [Enhygromyxa salina]|uniref:Laminin G domain protein n=1 Tax=Enhygromyxa salina TaxID=215803 RepID=A0A0C2CXF5_9BACT|nr:LamG domain-containing protein [Enhygromyxa salina]KIG14305.1 hypothetical protein DB30_06907 [Enhygromyxa salina]
MTARARHLVQQLAWGITGALAGLATPACTLPTSFACLNSSQCGGGGQCVAGGCAFPDGDCPSGYRYGVLSPEGLAGLCVPVGFESSVSDDSGSGEDMLDTSESASSASSDTTDTNATSESESESESDTSDTDPTDTETTDTNPTDTGTTGEIPDTAIAHYSFDDIALPTIFDSSGNDFHAEMSSLQPTTPAIVGEGLSFTSTDHVIVPLGVLAGRTAFTIEYYVRVTQPTQPRQFILYYGHEVDTAAKPNLTVYVEHTVPPLRTARVLWAAGNQNYGLVGTTPLDQNEWHHVALTFDNSGMRMYVDHFLNAEDPFVPSLLSPNLAYIQIGGLPTGFGGFVGTIDELRFSEGALTPGELQPVP